MNIELVGKDLPLSDMLKARIEQKLEKIETRLGQKLFVRVKLSNERNSYSCAIHFNGAGSEFQATGTAEDLIKAADDSISKIERQVVRLQDKGEPKRSMTMRGVWR